MKRIRGNHLNTANMLTGHSLSLIQQRQQTMRSTKFTLKCQITCMHLRSGKRERLVFANFLLSASAIIDSVGPALSSQPTAVLPSSTELVISVCTTTFFFPPPSPPIFSTSDAAAVTADADPVGEKELARRRVGFPQIGVPPGVLGIACPFIFGIGMLWFANISDFHDYLNRDPYTLRTRHNILQYRLLQAQPFGGRNIEKTCHATNIAARCMSRCAQRMTSRPSFFLRRRCLIFFLNLPCLTSASC
jgi:hypothetical protein